MEKKDTIELFNTRISKLQITNQIYFKLKKNKYRFIKDFIYAGYEKFEEIKDLTKEEKKLIIERLKQFDIDIKDTKQCQELIENYEEERMNKIAVKTQIDDMDLSVRAFNCLLRHNNLTILDIIYDDNIKDIRNLGLKCFTEIKDKLKEYGIDYDDKNQREELIKKYNEMCFKDGIKKHLEKTIDDLEKEYYVTLYKSEGTFEELRKNGYETLLDLIINRKNIMYCDKLIRTFGIDIKNEKQCKELIEQYENEKEYQKNQTTSNEKEFELLNKVTNDNNSLENELIRKQKVLRELKEQLERRTKLQQQLSECDKEYSELIRQYNTLNSKESGNNHGTK